MNIQEILFGGGGILFLLLSLIEIAPLKLNPWSKFFGWLGRAFNAPALKEIKALRGELDTIRQTAQDTQNKLDTHISFDAKKAADDAREAILHFNRELLRNMRHTREDYVDILQKIDQYETYCEENEDYENNRAVLAIAHIKHMYTERLEKRDFLSEVDQ